MGIVGIKKLLNRTSGRCLLILVSKTTAITPRQIIYIYKSALFPVFQGCFVPLIVQGGEWQLGNFLFGIRSDERTFPVSYGLL